MSKHYCPRSFDEAILNNYDIHDVSFELDDLILVLFLFAYLWLQLRIFLLQNTHVWPLHTLTASAAHTARSHSLRTHYSNIFVALITRTSLMFLTHILPTRLPPPDFCDFTISHPSRCSLTHLPFQPHSHTHSPSKPPIHMLPFNLCHTPSPPSCTPTPSPYNLPHESTTTSDLS